MYKHLYIHTSVIYYRALSLYVYMYVQMCVSTIYEYIYIYMHTHIHVCTQYRIYSHSPSLICIYICTCRFSISHMYIYMYTQICIYTYVYAHASSFIYIYMYMQICVHMPYIYMHTYIHVYTQYYNTFSLSMSLICIYTNIMYRNCVFMHISLYIQNGKFAQLQSSLPHRHDLQFFSVVRFVVGTQTYDQYRFRHAGQVMCTGKTEKRRYVCLDVTRRASLAGAPRLSLLPPTHSTSTKTRKEKVQVGGAYNRGHLRSSFGPRKRAR